MRKKSRIGFAGEGWGAVAAVKSLKNFFTIQCLSNDVNVTQLLDNEDKLIDEFSKFEVDYVLCAGYKPVVKKQFLLRYNVLNVHYSKLPMYRGLHSTAWAIINGEKELGWTMHVMNEYIDDGPIIYQESVKNDEVTSAPNYMSYFNNRVETILGEKVKMYLDGEISAHPQDKSLATWVARRTPRHNFINFDESVKQIQRLFRVLQTPYPLPRCAYQKEEFEVSKAIFRRSAICPEKGRILNIDSEGIWVGCQDGYVIIQELSKNNLKIKDFKQFKLGLYLNDFNK